MSFVNWEGTFDQPGSLLDKQLHMFDQIHRSTVLFIYKTT